jgi:hypothetical protein
MVNQDVVRPQSERIVARTAWPQWAGALVAGGLALLLYVRTAAPGLTWAHDGADGGDLIAAAMNWGVPHPSGYPTYCLLARLFALLPLGSIARRFNLFSSASAALAVSVLYLCARRCSLGAALPGGRRPSSPRFTLCKDSLPRSVCGWRCACAIHHGPNPERVHGWHWASPLAWGWVPT